jgi:hypothetical protein
MKQSRGDFACQHCPNGVILSQSPNGTITYTYFIVSINGKNYQAIFLLDSETFILYCHGGENGYELCNVLELNYLPNINPTNAVKKLQTILTFL